MIDIGKEIRAELLRQERTAGWLAAKVGEHRSLIYRCLTKNSIDTDLLQRISLALRHNFFQEYCDALDRQ